MKKIWILKVFAVLLIFGLVSCGSSGDGGVVDGGGGTLPPIDGGDGGNYALFGYVMQIVAPGSYVGLIEGAKVELLSGGEVIREGITDDLGRYMFTSLYSGTYYLQASREGCTTDGYEVYVGSYSPSNRSLYMMCDE